MTSPASEGTNNNQIVLQDVIDVARDLGIESYVNCGTWVFTALLGHFEYDLGKTATEKKCIVRAAKLSKKQVLNGITPAVFAGIPRIGPRLESIFVELQKRLRAE